MTRAGRLAIALVLLLGACSDGGDDDGGDATPPPKAVVRVLAPDALTEAFNAIGDRFASSHPGTRVDFVFAGSDTLLAEIERGRAAAVLATANPLVMQQAVDRGWARDPVQFASNRLALVVPSGNPKGITGLTDLGRDDVRLALCEQVVVCGALARDALTAAGVDRAPTTTGVSARDVLHQVVSGRADAGIVFTTTVGPAEPVELIGEVPDVPEAVYEITVLAGAVDRDGAEEWVAYVTGPEGRAVLGGLGFDEP